jgi:hypothetical protein
LGADSEGVEPSLSGRIHLPIAYDAPVCASESIAADYPVFRVDARVWFNDSACDSESLVFLPRHHDLNPGHYSPSGGHRDTLTNMLVESNWGNFRAKFNGKEQKSFEWLCSLLFYKEHGCPKGALRYLNQTGIEAEPIKVNQDVIGWQAKFISSEISGQKAVLKKAIDNATTENPSLTCIFFYLNRDFPQSNKRGVKEPSYKTEIEEHGKAKGVNIVWRTAGFFETPFVCEENANIVRHFFTLEKSVIDFIQELSRHTESILEPIRTEIAFNGAVIKIDRSTIVARLKNALASHSLLIVSGEAGVGKTALIKHLYNEVKDATPIFVFKATEFNISNANQLFKDYGSFTLSDSCANTKTLEKNTLSSILPKNSQTLSVRRFFRSS